MVAVVRLETPAAFVGMEARQNSGSMITRALRAFTGGSTAPTVETTHRQRLAFVEHRDEICIDAYRSAHRLDAKTADEDWTATVQFVEMCKRNPGVAFAPSNRQDRMLHFVLNRTPARRAMERALGAKIVHREKIHARTADVDRTIVQGRSTFGERLNEPAWNDHHRSNPCTVMVSVS